MVFCLKFSCYCACIVSDYIMGVLETLVVFFLRVSVWSHVVNYLFFAPFPFFQCLIHLLSFILGHPSPLTCTWSFQWFHYHVLSILFVHFLCTLGVFDLHCTCFWSFSCTFYEHQMLSILIARALCTFWCMLGAINLHYVCFMRTFIHANCFWSLLRMLYVH